MVLFVVDHVIHQSRSRKPEECLQPHVMDQPKLDWLRFVLASVVVLVHSGVTFPGPIDGGLAVWVFLALSGWLIGGILLRTDQKDLPRFYYNRAIRIWIPYGCAIAMLYGAAAIMEGIDANWWKYLFYDVTFTHYNFTVFPQALDEMPLDGTGNNYWSISVEEQFYLIAPFLLSFTGLVPRALAAVAFALAVLFVGIAFLPIAGGVLAAAAQKKFGDWHLTPQGRVAVWGLAILSFGYLWWDNNLLIASVFSVAVVLILSTPGRRNRLALFFGAISFPLYLNAWIGMFAANIVARKIALPEQATIYLRYFLAVLAAIACWYLIDRPVRARRDQWYTPQLGRMAAVAAYVSVTIGWLGGHLIKWYGT
jgi:peptidoglycan/LPS O-acetylase OafA/YrhL